MRSYAPCTLPVECFRPASPLFHLGFAGSHQREPITSNYSTAGGLPVLRFGLGSIASNMMIGK